MPRAAGSWGRAALAALTAGCASTVGSGAGDGGPDVRADAVAAPDANEAPVDLCDAGVVDMDRHGVRFGATTVLRYGVGQLTAGGVTPPSDGCGAPVTSTHRLVVRYTPRAGGRLHVRLDPDYGAVPPRGQSLADRLLLLDGCAASSRVVECSGPWEHGRSYIRYAYPFTTRGRVGAGRAVYVVARTTPLAGSLAITEVADETPVGARCQRDGAPLAAECAAGSSCVEGRCAPDGSRGAACREGPAPCDPGLACITGGPRDRSSHCERLARAGEPCGDAQCDDGACVRLGGVARCVAAGAFQGPCRGEDAPCDAGLSCRGAAPTSSSACLPALASGARCAPGPQEAGCPDGEGCAPAGGLWRCVRAGSEGGLCREPDGACDAGLGCDLSEGLQVCVRPAREGARCTPATPDPCGLGARCVADPDGGRCVRLGAAGGVCGVWSGCDAGLRCGRENRCVAPGAEGERCEAGELRVRQCAVGLSCVLVPREDGVAEGRCVRDGARDGACRSLAPHCDAGLACDGSWRCRAAAEGGACGETPAAGACARGERCAGTCRADGAAGGWCRLTSPRCDAGLACVRPLGVAPPYCVPEVGAGAACGWWGSGEGPLCADGLACRAAGDGANATCRADPSAVLRPCAAGGAPCPAGARCDRGLCRPVAAVGERCDGATCVEGASCLPEPDASRSVCRADGAERGACRGGAGCDPGLACRPSRGGPVPAERCVREVSLGEACEVTSACAAGGGCVAGRCAPQGGDGEPCRGEGGPCADGLVCRGGRCHRALATGEVCFRNREPQCVAGLACDAGDDGTPRCGPSPYATEVGVGAGAEDPCALPVEGLATPLRFRLFGRELEAAVTARGGVVLRDPAGPPDRAAPFVVSTGDGENLQVGADDAGGTAPACSRVVGRAPTRRLVVGGGLATFEDRTAATVTVHEGSNVVELRALRLGSGVPRGVYATLTLARQAVTVYVPSWAAGTVVRFVPR